MSVKLFIKRNAPTILTYIGSAGVIATSIAAIKATPKAIRLLEEAKKEKGDELTDIETIKITAPVYIPTAVLGVSTIFCIFGANVLNKKTQAALTSAYALLDSTYKEYRNKAIELYGEEFDEEVREEIAKDKYKESDTLLHDNEELFFDEYSKRYFKSTKHKVKEAEYYINRDLTMRDYAYLNEFYDYLDIEPIDSGWKLGWSVGACMDMYWQPWIDFSHKKMVMDDGTECIAITIFQDPIIDFEDY